MSNPNATCQKPESQAGFAWIRRHMKENRKNKFKVSTRNLSSLFTMLETNWTRSRPCYKKWKLKTGSILIFYGFSRFQYDERYEVAHTDQKHNQYGWVVLTYAVATSASNLVYMFKVSIQLFSLFFLNVKELNFFVLANTHDCRAVARENDYTYR